MLIYPLGCSHQLLILTERVLDHVQRHRQVRKTQREAGGQLFARFDGDRIIVEEATGPRRSDRRSRLTYAPDRPTEQAEIIERHKRGLHYIGDWHTHPERLPAPSEVDTKSMAACVVQSTHTLNAFVLMVVGTAAPPAGLHMSLHDGTHMIVLQPVPSDVQGAS